MMWKCKLFGHKPGKERAVFGYFGTIGHPDMQNPLWYVAQDCERCGQILKVLWPPKEEVIKRCADD